VRAGPAALLAAAALSCAPALQKRTPGEPPRAAPAVGGTADAAALVAEGREHFSHRAEPGEAQEAERLFLAAAERDGGEVDGLYGAIQARIWRIDHEAGVDRPALSAAAVDAGQACLERVPESALCHYGLALALGIQARERRATATDGLRKMVENLRTAARRDPGLDQAGPDRVLALVLVRAPGWPVGPGDVDASVEAARRAVELAPGYPPNRLALAETLIAAGRGDEGKAEAKQALSLARGYEGDPDQEAWLKQGKSLLARAERAS